MLELHAESHVDHVPEEIVRFVLENFKDRDGFFIETIALPEHLGTVPCGLHGPLMGDPPVPESEVRYQPRGARQYPSRLVNRPVRQVNTLTVITGPHDGRPCVLYTIFGGPTTPQEPADPTCKDKAASERFWAEHALCG